MGSATLALPGAGAVFYNPAALQSRGRRSLSATHGQWIRDVRHEYLAYLFGGEQRVYGVAVQVSQARDLEYRAGPSAEPLGEFGVYDGALNVACSHRLGPGLRAGVNLKLVRQSIYTETATGAAVDFGLLYRARDHVQLALALRNLGRMNELDQTATPLPRSLRLGLAYAGAGALLLSAEAQRAAGSPTTWHLGGQYRLGRLLVARGGYQTAAELGPSLGLGVRARAWNLDYAFVPFGSGLGEAHRLSVEFHWGQDAAGSEPPR